ncbi:MAG: YraN family protein [Candidatus Thiodiazotropha sp.]|jgi:putative endonuclease
MSSDHLQQGAQAEQQALDYLSRRGLKLVERNYRCKVGEIDLIMKERDALIFVEVRFRQSSGFGSPLESITPSKQRKLLAAANQYLQVKQKDQPCRFDVVALNGSKLPRVEWIKNAFQSGWS